MKKTINFMTKSSKWLLVVGIVFSQLSFPLGVLAEEITEDVKMENTLLEQNAEENLDNEEDTIVDNEETGEVVLDDNNVTDGANDALGEGEYVGDKSDDEFAEEPVVNESVIKINGNEVLDDTYTISDDNLILEVYVDDTYMDKLDFSNKLYGTYTYTIESIGKEITINYNSDNRNVLEKFIKNNDSRLTYVEDSVVVNGFSEGLKVDDIKAYYDLESVKASIEVKRNGNLLDSEEFVRAGDKLTIIDNSDDRVVNNTSMEYTINSELAGDINLDGNVDDNDRLVILDDIVNDNINDFNDLDRDGLSIVDATKGLSSNEDDMTYLENTLVVDNSSVFIGDEIEVKLYVKGFATNYLYGIEYLLNYDRNVLELVSLCEGNCASNLDNTKFAYLVKDGFNSEDVALVTLRFKTLAEGDTTITMSGILESFGNGAYKSLNDTNTVNISISNYGKGGDVDYNGEVVNTTLKVEDVSNAVLQVVNNLNNTQVDDDNTETITEDKATTDDDKAVKNNKKKEADDEEKEKNSTSKTIIIILIILVIIGLIYVIFKDDEEEDSDNKKDVSKKSNSKNK